MEWKRKKEWKRRMEEKKGSEEVVCLFGFSREQQHLASDSASKILVVFLSSSVFCGERRWFLSLLTEIVQ